MAYNFRDLQKYWGYRLDDTKLTARDPNPAHATHLGPFDVDRYWNTNGRLLDNSYKGDYRKFKAAVARFGSPQVAAVELYGQDAEWIPSVSEQYPCGVIETKSSLEDKVFIPVIYGRLPTNVRQAHDDFVEKRYGASLLDKLTDPYYRIASAIIGTYQQRQVQAMGKKGSRAAIGGSEGRHAYDLVKLMQGSEAKTVFDYGVYIIKNPAAPEGQQIFQRADQARLGVITTGSTLCLESPLESEYPWTNANALAAPLTDDGRLNVGVSDQERAKRSFYDLINRKYGDGTGDPMRAYKYVHTGFNDATKGNGAPHIALNILYRMWADADLLNLQSNRGNLPESSKTLFGKPATSTDKTPLDYAEDIVKRAFENERMYGNRGKATLPILIYMSDIANAQRIWKAFDNKRGFAGVKPTTLQEKILISYRQAKDCRSYNKSRAMRGVMAPRNGAPLPKELNDMLDTDPGVLNESVQISAFRALRGAWHDMSETWTAEQKIRFIDKIANARGNIDLGRGQTLSQWISGDITNVKAQEIAIALQAAESLNQGKLPYEFTRRKNELFSVSRYKDEVAEAKDRGLAVSEVAEFFTPLHFSLLRSQEYKETIRRQNPWYVKWRSKFNKKIAYDMQPSLWHDAAYRPNMEYRGKNDTAMRLEDLPPSNPAAPTGAQPTGGRIGAPVQTGRPRAATGLTGSAFALELDNGAVKPPPMAPRSDRARSVDRRPGPQAF